MEYKQAFEQLDEDEKPGLSKSKSVAIKLVLTILVLFSIGWFLNSVQNALQIALSIILLIFGVTFIFAAAVAPFSLTKTPRWKRLSAFAGSGMLAIGTCGFFGSALSVAGGLNWLPSSFEWPVGYAQGVVTTSDHQKIVLLRACGRIQVYDPDWNFVTGWPIQAGPASKLNVAEDDRIQVITSLDQSHYVFELDGTLVSKEAYAPATYESFPDNGKSMVVPTALWLWPFSHPLISWVFFAIGISIVGFVTKQDRK